MAFRSFRERIREAKTQQQLWQQNPIEAAAAVGVNLPQNWLDLSEKQKADWLVANKVTYYQLTKTGISVSDLQALENVGYYDVLARQEAEERQTFIKDNFVNIYNNNNLTTQQKAQQINQFAQQNYISRDEIASAMNLGANDLNAFLDTDPAIVQNRVNNLLQTATTEIKYNDPRYTTEVRDDEGNTGYVWNAAGQQAQREKQEAEKQLIALGYEFFDPDGDEIFDEAGTRNTAPARWLSPQEAANVTGTKINNQLRNQAYIQSTENLASQLSPLANQLRQSLDAVNSSGGMLKSDPAYFYNKIAEELTSKTGITDLNDIGYRKLEGRWIDLGGDPPVSYFIRSGSNQIELYDDEFYNKKTGYVFPNGRLPNFKYGNRDNETGAYFKLGPDGKPKLTTYYAYEQEPWKDVVTALAPIALNFVPGVGQFLGAAILPAGTSAAIQTAVGNAVLKAGIDVATGVPVETALKNGLVSVGINQVLPNLSGNAYIDNAVKAVSVAALTGGDVEAALVNSVISTGGKEAFGNVSLTGDKVVDSAIASAVTSGLSAAATGGDVGASVAQGFGSGLSASINTQNQVTTIPGVTTQTITGAAGNDSIPAGVGFDTVGGIAGADTVNAGVAENDVLDLIQRDIDTSVANNVQGNLNAEQEIQSATPVEPGTSDFTIPGGTTVGEFAEPSTGGFSRTPVVTTPPPATSTTSTDAGGGRGSATGKTAEQEAKLNQIAQDLAAKRATTPSVSDNAVIDFGAVSPESNAQGLSGTRADKIFETTARYVAAPALKGVGELIELGGVGYGALTGDRNNAAQQLGQRISTQGRNITLQQVLDEQKDIRNAIKNAPDVFGTLSDNLAAEQLNYENIGAFDPNVTQSEIDTSMTLANKAVAGTIAAVNNPVGFGDWVLTELFQEPLPLGLGVVAGKTAQAVAKSDAFNRFAAKTLGVNVSDDAAKIGLAGAVTTSVATNAAEAGLASYKDVFDELKSRNFSDDYAHEQASKAFAVSAGTTLAVGAFVDKSLLEPFFSGANTSLNKRLGTQAVTGGLTETVQAGGQGAGEQYFTDGKFDYEKLTDKIVLEALVGTGSNVSAQLGTDVIADKPAPTALPADGGTVLPSTPPPSNSGVVVAVDPDTNQASVIDDGGNITIIPAEDLTPGQNIALPSTPVDTSPVVDQPVVDQPVVDQPVVTEPPVTEPVVTEPVVTEPPIAEPVITQPVVTTPPVLTPEQIAAQELDAEVQKIMRMAVKKDPVDMRYDLNKDGRVNVIDALALKRGQATVPTVEEYQASLAQQTVAPQPGIAEPPITQPAVTEPVTQEPLTQDIVTTAPSTTPSVTQPVEQTPSVEPPSPPPIVEQTPPTSEVTGIVLQNNGDGTALVLTNDGNATNVPVTDAVSNEPLTPGASVTVDQNTNTATVTPPASDVEKPVVQEPTSPPQPPPAVSTTPEEPITEPPQEPVVSVPPTVQDTGDQQILGGGQQPTTDAGSIIDTPIGTDTSTPAVTPGLDVNVNPNVNVDEPIPPVDELPLVDEFLPVEDRLPPLPPPVKTEEDLLLEQIIRELEPTPPVSEGVPIPEPVFPEPPLVLPESPTINVGDRLAVRPVVDRGYRRPSVSPGSRVEESTQILPIRPGLSEGGTDGIEGTTEQEQEPVWNVRSLKLRRLLGI